MTAGGENVLLPFSAPSLFRHPDKYQTVLFEGVRYSVPRRVAFEPVTVKAHVDRVVLVHKGQAVATHMNGESYRFRESAKAAREKKTTK